MSRKYRGKEPDLLAADDIYRNVSNIDVFFENDMRIKFKSPEASDNKKKDDKSKDTPQQLVSAYNEPKLNRFHVIQEKRTNTTDYIQARRMSMSHFQVMEQVKFLENLATNMDNYSDSDDSESDKESITSSERSHNSTLFDPTLSKLKSTNEVKTLDDELIHSESIDESVSKAKKPITNGTRAIGTRTSATEGNLVDIMMILSHKMMVQIKQEFEKPRNLDHGLSVSMFLSMLHSCLKDFITDKVEFACQVIELFKQIDANGDGRIQWDEFTSYIVEAALAQRTNQTMIRPHEFVESLPRPKDKSMPKKVKFATFLGKSLDQLLVIGDEHPFQCQTLKINYVDECESGSNNTDKDEYVGNSATISMNKVIHATATKIRHQNTSGDRSYAVITAIHCPFNDTLISSSELCASSTKNGVRPSITGSSKNDKKDNDKKAFLRSATSKPKSKTISSELSFNYNISIWNSGNKYFPLVQRIGTKLPCVCFAWCDKTNLLFCGTSSDVVNGVNAPIVARDSVSLDIKYELKWHTHKITKLLIVRGNISNVLISTAIDGTLVVWDTFTVLSQASTNLIKKNKNTHNNNVNNNTNSNGLEQIQTWMAHDFGVRDMCVGNHSEIVGTIGFTRKSVEASFHAKLWNYKTGKLIADLKGHQFAPISIAMNDNSVTATTNGGGSNNGGDKDMHSKFGNIVVTADIDSQILIWNLNSFELIQKIDGKRVGLDSLYCMKLLVGRKNKQKEVVTDAKESQIIAFGNVVRAFHIKQVLPISTPLISAHYNRTSVTIITVTGRTMKVWDGCTGLFLRSFSSKLLTGSNSADITALTFDRRERKVIVGTSSGRIRVHNYINGALMKELDPHEDSISQLHYCDLNGSVISELETQGPRNWSSSDIRRKYRNEFNRNRAWLSYLEAKNYAETRRC